MGTGKNKAAAALGKLGGKSRSQAKIDAVRINIAKARAVKAAGKPEPKNQASITPSSGACSEGDMGT